MNTEAMTRYADAVCMKYETEQRVSGQEKQAMADRKFFSGTDFDLMLFAKEKIEFEGSLRNVQKEYDLTDEQAAVLKNLYYDTVLTALL